MDETKAQFIDEQFNHHLLTRKHARPTDAEVLAMVGDEGDSELKPEGESDGRKDRPGD